MSSPLTHEEAEALRAELAEYYGEPVWPLAHVCEVLEEWFRACEQAKSEHSPESGRSRPPLYDIVEKLSVNTLDVIKSNYLGRRLYGGENHRSEKCPVHKGHWSGLWTNVPTGCTCAEPNGNRAGWVPAGQTRLLSAMEKAAERQEAMRRSEREYAERADRAYAERRDAETGG